MKKGLFKPAATKGLEWIEEETENHVAKIIPISDSNTYLPKETAKQGLPEGWTRATFIMREQYLEDLKNIAYWDRETIKTVLDVILDRFLKGKKVPPRKK
ncbi:hypothetical protein HN446_05020 [bacterium]|jgi:hypothetical protein|nr:hypothetical protein [bacterium]